ncbi:MAG: hypothetical protein HC924_08910 [Synechococcaceae cyanobacterium SM2_3_2]|nr:hypothetical protein [Synechococcaceae cyanobacterium SM2_3_2]
MRYPMQIAQDPLSSLVLPLFQLNATNAFVEMVPDELRVKAGSLFDERFSLSNLGRAELVSWEWYMGLGLRTDFQGTVAPVTSTEKVIAIPLLQQKVLFLPILGPLGVQVPCRRIVVSLRDVDTFLTSFNAGRVKPEEGPSSISID